MLALLVLIEHHWFPADVGYIVYYYNKYNRKNDTIKMLISHKVNDRKNEWQQ